MQLEITVNKKKHKVGLQWGLGCFEIAAKHFDVVSVDQVWIMFQEDSTSRAKIIYSAIQNWIELQDETAEVPFTYRQLINWLDGYKDYPKIIEDFENSMFNGKPITQHWEEVNARLAAIQKEQEEEEKKKKAEIDQSAN